MPAITISELQTDVQKAIRYGSPVRFRYFTETTNVGSYDTATLTSGTNAWSSGLLMPMKVPRGTNNFTLQQGRQEQADKMLYVLGNVVVSGTWRVGIGSPIADEYAPTEGGIHTWELAGSAVYRRIFLKHLPTGSLYGE